VWYQHLKKRAKHYLVFGMGYFATGIRLPNDVERGACKPATPLAVSLAAIRKSVDRMLAPPYDAALTGA
jgi:hypothetical protein